MDSRLLEMLMEERPEGDLPERPAAHPVLCVRTRTITSGSMTEVEIYPVYRWGYRKQLRKVRPTPEAMRTVNDRNARKRFERMAETNFRAGQDHFLTLTYGEAAPETVEECRKDLRNYMARVNRARAKLGLDKARAMGVIETGKNGRLHHHLIIEGGLSRDRMEELWGHGYANCDRIQGNGMAALCRYCTKSFNAKRDKGRHRYFYTRNLKSPRVTESESRISRRQAERIREEAEIEGERILRKKYPGHVLEGIEIRQTDWLPGAYIYARMRRTP